jgi:hypothetical protein
MLFGLLRRNASAEWPAIEPVPLRFDAAARALNGLPLGAPLERIAQFGRPDEPKDARRYGLYNYGALGMTVGAEGGRVAWFKFYFEAPDESFRPCTLQLLVPRGGVLEMTSTTTQRDVESALGRPEARTARADQRAIGFRFAESWLEVTFSPDGQLLVLDVDPGPPAG